MWIDSIMIVILTICVITDLKTRKIYNNVIFPSLLAAFFVHLAEGGWTALGYSLLGCGVGLGLLLIPYALGGMGAGDVKLLALIGALKGTLFVLVSAVYMSLAGALIAILVLLFRQGAWERLKRITFFVYGLCFGVKVPLGLHKGSLSATYPYGLAIAAGAVLSLFSKEWFTG